VAKKRAKTRRTPRVPAARRGLANDPAIVAIEMGRPLSIQYHHTDAGRQMVHLFKGRARLYRTRDGKHLIIGPVRAGRYIED